MNRNNNIEGTFLQVVDYRYNIRGWLSRINNADVGMLADDNENHDYFGMELGRNEPLMGLTAGEAFNGNISSVQWSKGNGSAVAVQAYLFSYDPMNRLTFADHFDYDPSAQTWQNNNNSYSESLTYNLNGNIKTLHRRGFGGLNIDDLTYQYLGNQLQYIGDSGDPNKGFPDLNSTADDYAYDLNGNLIKDKNRAINNNGDIRYNMLNLVDEVVKGNESVRYIYDSNGRKLSQQVHSAHEPTLMKRTDYIGDLVFEGSPGILKFIHHNEGRIVPGPTGWEYQYYIKDHLGSVRVLFTSKPQESKNYSANMEPGHAVSGVADFTNYSSSPYDLVDHTDEDGTIYQHVQILNGGENGRVGLGKSLVVMPGDEIAATVYGKYRNLSNNENITSFAVALAAAFGVSSASTGEGLKLYNGLTEFASMVPFGDHTGDDETAPKAFITILFFDKDYNLIDAAWDQISKDGEQVSGLDKEPPHDLLSVTAKASEAGFAYVFLSNEHYDYVDVYFDDLTLIHTLSPIVNSSDYYPFGMPYNDFARQNATPNNFLYNGKERQDEFDLGWLDYGARMYMPEIGRWFTVDPASETYYELSPYRYAFNNPLNVVDRDGMIEWPLWGTYVIQKNESEYLSNQSVYSRSKDWIEQTGDFETAEETAEYRSYVANPDENAIIRTSAWDIRRKSTEETPMTSPHRGTDFRASVGTSVYSLGDGKIVSVDRTNGVLVVEYRNGDRVTFRHLSSIGNFQVGQTVYEGQVIANSGRTNTTMAHLHVEAINSQGQRVNFENRRYGYVSNQEFFTNFNGDYNYLRLYKLAKAKGTSYEQQNYTLEQWTELLQSLLR